MLRPAALPSPSPPTLQSQLQLQIAAVAVTITVPFAAYLLFQATVRDCCLQVTDRAAVLNVAGTVFFWHTIAVLMLPAIVIQAAVARIAFSHRRLRVGCHLLALLLLQLMQRLPRAAELRRNGIVLAALATCASW